MSWRIMGRSRVTLSRSRYELLTFVYSVRGWSLIVLAIQPVVNPMLGPSSSALINLGARFPPCMKLIKDIPLDTNLPCAPPPMIIHPRPHATDTKNSPRRK